MNNLQIYIQGLIGVGNKFWFALIYIIAALIFLWRTERNDKKRNEEAAKRKIARRIYLEEFIDRRY